MPTERGEETLCRSGLFPCNYRSAGHDGPAEDFLLAAKAQKPILVILLHAHREMENMESCGDESGVCRIYSRPGNGRR